MYDYNNLTRYDGVVISNKDPEAQFRVQAVYVGGISTETMLTKNIPWMRPLETNPQSCSLVPVGQHIYVYVDNNDKTHQTFYYEIKPTLNASTKTFTSEENEETGERKLKGEANVIMNVENGSGNSAIIYNANEGMNVMHNNSGIHIGNEGDIKLTGGNGDVSIQMTGEGIELHCGHNNITYPASYNVAAEVLSTIYHAISHLVPVSVVNGKIVCGFGSDAFMHRITPEGIEAFGSIIYALNKVLETNKLKLNNITVN